MAATGRIFNIQRFSLKDGPGIRTTVFLKGCPARCLWCHNPESQKAGPEIVVLAHRCIACDACREACPQGLARPGLPVDAAHCEACAGCVAACPTEARQLAGRTPSVDDVMREVLRDRLFFEDSGGGVTFSGGEPLAQPEFLRELLVACRSERIHTAVDTCGWAAREDLLALAPLVDLFLFDLKLMDDARHRELTGLPLGPILENLRALGSEHPRIWLRVPVVPGHTDSEQNLAAIADVARDLPGVRQVDLLPYHSTGAQKFARLGRSYALAGLSPPPQEQMAAHRELFEARGLTTRVGGWA
jgi:pyruvate formate lyase activating enzyme